MGSDDIFKKRREERKKRKREFKENNLDNGKYEKIKKTSLI